MVGTGIEKVPVVGHEYISPFAVQISGHRFSRSVVEVIGRLVYEQKSIVPEKQCGQQHLRPFTMAERFKLPIQHIVRHLHQIQLPHNLPELQVGIPHLYDINRQALRVLYFVRKIFKFHAG